MTQHERNDGTLSKIQADPDATRSKPGPKGPQRKTEVLRVSFLIPKDDIKKIEWMMEEARVPTKVDLLREALNRLEDQLLVEAAERKKLRKAAGAPI